MTTDQAKRYIFVSLVLIVALTFVREVRKGDLPEPRIAIGAFAAAIVLNLLAGPAPKVAGGLALVALVASAMNERSTIEAMFRLTER